MITISANVIQQSVPRRSGSFMTLYAKQQSHSEYGDDGHIDFKSDRDSVYLSRLQEDIEEDLEFSDDEENKTEDVEFSVSVSTTMTTTQQQPSTSDDTHFGKFEVGTLSTSSTSKSGLSSMMQEVSELNAFREASMSTYVAAANNSPNNPHTHDTSTNASHNANHDTDNHNHNFSDIDNTLAIQGSYRRHATIDPKNYGHSNNASSSSSHAVSSALMNLRIIFSEFEFDKSIDVVLEVDDADTTVEQMVTRVLHSFDATHPTKQLASYQSSDYEVRQVDDDDLNDDDLDEDELDPPLTRSAKICDFAAAAQRQVTMALCFNGKYINGAMMSSPRSNTSMMSSQSTTVVSPRGNSSFRLNPFSSRSPSTSITVESDVVAVDDTERKLTYNKLAQETQMLFVRVFIPGPLNEVNVVLSVDQQEIGHKFLRDLFSALNRKRKTNAFNAQYFDFYYKAKTKQYGAIANSTKVTDLVDKNIMILPKVLSAQHSQLDEAEAYQFEYVKLANQVRQFKAFKIDKYRSKKKAFLLEVDRYRFVKTSLESTTFSNGNNPPKPVPIEDIVSVRQTEKDNGHRRHHDQFTITYKVMNQNHKVKVKVKTYQMASNQEREDIVNKLRYLCVLRKHQG
eukprot:CAMPEP_0202693110 /NCGR_PEP_ID=MMETSP1385-20130828/7321_1 /ASSEMBLY_ACC=CAM_ASM_000861 /TAXON_ID=933848 /ORGANISM="Elphidium margaritaceum" /LENGTH=623 /DNA_ID=CAMNT_0049348751 /DNA_START=37 /DNA_END=1908 /DNA_ORIENTATION=+